MNALLPRAPAMVSIPACGGATQPLTRVSAPGSASMTALPSLPAGSGLAGGSSGHITPPALPSLTGVRRPRGTVSPPAQAKRGPPGSANKTAPKTPRTSKTTSAAHRGLEFGAAGGQASKRTGRERWPGALSEPASPGLGTFDADRPRRPGGSVHRHADAYADAGSFHGRRCRPVLRTCRA